MAKKDTSDLEQFYSFDRFDSTYNVDLASYLMLKNPKPKAAPAPAAAAPAPAKGIKK